MPLLDTLKFAEEFRQAGFPDPQARILASKFEETAQAISQDFKAALRAEMSALRQELLEAIRATEARIDAKFEALEARIDAKFEALEARIDAKFEGVDAKFDGVDAKFEGMESKFDLKIERLRVELHSSLSRQTLAFAGILIAAVTLAVAVIKSFPNWFQSP